MSRHGAQRRDTVRVSPSLCRPMDRGRIVAVVVVTFAPIIWGKRGASTGTVWSSLVDRCPSGRVIDVPDHA